MSLINEIATSRAEQSLTPSDYKKHCEIVVARDLINTEYLGESLIAPVLFGAIADDIEAEVRFVDKKEEILKSLVNQR